MDKQKPMYELTFPAPSFSDEAYPRTLVVALEGYADAGNAVFRAAQYLTYSLENAKVASFNTDELIDYRARRPMALLSYNQVEEMDEHDLSVQMLTDCDGRPFWLLTGPEPDYRWQAFSSAVADLVDHFNIDQTLVLYSAAQGVPHTRPMIVAAHGNASHLLDRFFLPTESQLALPGSASMMIELDVNKRGGDVAGYTTFVPFYTADRHNPMATLHLLNAVSLVGKLNLPLKALEADARSFGSQLEATPPQLPNWEQIVAQLETDYDESLQQHEQEHPDSILPSESGLPSSDQIGDAAENFLDTLTDDAKEDLLTGDPGEVEGSRKGQVTVTEFMRMMEKNNEVLKEVNEYALELEDKKIEERARMLAAREQARKAKEEQHKRTADQSSEGKEQHASAEENRHRDHAGQEKGASDSNSSRDDDDEKTLDVKDLGKGVAKVVAKSLKELAREVNRRRGKNKNK